MRPVLMILAAVALAACAETAAEAPPTTPAKASATPVLAAGETVLGQPIAWPEGSPEVTAVIVTLPPGVETGWHTHPVPLFGYLLSGEIVVAYRQADGTVTERHYGPGEGLMEAITTPHNGRNPGTEDARILAVFMGAEGVPNTEKAE